MNCRRQSRFIYIFLFILNQQRGFLINYNKHRHIGDAAFTSQPAYTPQCISFCNCLRTRKKNWGNILCVSCRWQVFSYVGLPDNFIPAGKIRKCYLSGPDIIFCGWDFYISLTSTGFFLNRYNSSYFKIIDDKFIFLSTTYPTKHREFTRCSVWAWCRHLLYNFCSRDLRRLFLISISILDCPGLLVTFEAII